MFLIMSEASDISFGLKIAVVVRIYFAVESLTELSQQWQGWKFHLDLSAVRDREQERCINSWKNSSCAYMQYCHIYVATYCCLSCEIFLTSSSHSMTSVVFINLQLNIINKRMRCAFVSFHWAKKSGKNEDFYEQRFALRVVLIRREYKHLEVVTITQKRNFIEIQSKALQEPMKSDSQMSEKRKLQHSLIFSSLVAADLALVDITWILFLTRIILSLWEWTYECFHHSLSIDLLCQIFQCRSHCFEIEMQRFDMLTQ